MGCNEYIWPSRRADKSAVGAMNRPLRRLRRPWDIVFHLFISIIGGGRGKAARRGRVCSFRILLIVLAHLPIGRYRRAIVDFGPGGPLSP